MSGASRPNFFLLLGLDPRARWDQAAFDQRVEEKRREWSKASAGVGKPALEAQRSIALIPQIKQIMGDDAARKTESEQAISQGAADQKAKLAQFDETLRISAAKGEILESEITAWIKNYADVLSEQEIRGRARATGAPIKAAAAAPSSRPAVPQLDPIIAKTIRERLDTLGETDLYTFLGLSRATATPTLAQKARDVNSDLQRNMNKTPELTMRIELAGNAINIFQSNDSRARYDETLRLASLDAILKKYEQVFSAARAVNEQQTALYLKEARAAGWSPEEALERLNALAIARKWVVRVGGVEAAAAVQVCGNCRTLNPSDAQFCSNCRGQLKLACPQCDATVQSDALACSKCGFPAGNRFVVDSQIDESQRLLNARQIDDAAVLITSAAQAWQGAKAGDARAQRIAQQRAAVDTARKQQSDARERLRALMDSERKYFAARALLDSLPANTLPNQDALRGAVDGAIAEAQLMLAEARAKPQGSDEAVALIQRALQTCADYQEARELLARNPPLAPSLLMSRQGGNMVSLSWQPSPTRGSLRYRVVRKAGSQPVSAQDGAPLETVAGLTYDDTKPEMGLPLYYAVYADREGVPSPQGAGLTQPVMFTPDVTGVVTRIADGVVELSWTKPANVKRILITRKEGGSPRDPRDGAALTTLDLLRVTDQGLRNETTYGYRITCQYTDERGGERLSPGVVIEATPQVPPAPITTFSIEQVQGGGGERDAVLRWTPPAKGKVVALKSQQPPRLASGAVIPEEQLRDHGQALDGRGDTLTDRWTTSGACYYTMVVVFQRMAYIGATQQFAAVDDVSDLKARNQGATARLTWTWPANCQSVTVAISARDWPARDDPTATLRKITKASYDAQQFCEIPIERDRDLFIVVYAEMVVSGASAPVFAAGRASGARARLRVASKVALEYEIKRVKPLFGKVQITLKLRVRPAAGLPAMIVRCKRNGLPFTKSDGDYVERVGPFSAVAETHEVELPVKDYGPETFGKLFLEDDSDYEVVEMNHPAKERLRLDA